MENKMNIYIEDDQPAITSSSHIRMRVTANLSLGAYEIFMAEADVTDPIWPDISFQGLLEIAFRDRFIRDLDHPVVKKLRGKL